jgi:hypothetical protein
MLNLIYIHLRALCPLSGMEFCLINAVFCSSTYTVSSSVLINMYRAVVCCVNYKMEILVTMAFKEIVIVKQTLQSNVQTSVRCLNFRHYSVFL